MRIFPPDDPLSKEGYGYARLFRPALRLSPRLSRPIGDVCKFTGSLIAASFFRISLARKTTAIARGMRGSARAVRASVRRANSDQLSVHRERRREKDAGTADFPFREFEAPSTASLAESSSQRKRMGRIAIRFLRFAFRRRGSPVRFPRGNQYRRWGINTGFIKRINGARRPEYSLRSGLLLVADCRAIVPIKQKDSVAIGARSH